MNSFAPTAADNTGCALHARLLAEARAAIALMDWDVREDERRPLDARETNASTLSVAG